MDHVNIKTAEEILKENYPGELDINQTLWNFKGIHPLMIEYAKQFIDLASEKATVRRIPGVGNIVEVNKQSILKIKQLIK